MGTTTFHLLHTPLESDYQHSLHFTTAASQAEYFMSKKVKTCTECTYQRKDQVIMAPYQIDSIIKANYVMYKNGDSDKWWYAFIKDMRYENEGCTIIEIETDVIQTWYFNYTIKPSFVEREHVRRDTVGLHTVPERLELGDYIVQNANKNGSIALRSYIVGTTVNLNTPEYDPCGGLIYNGIYSGVRYYRIDTEDAINTLINTLTKAGKADAIVSIFCCPTSFVNALIPDGGSYSEVQGSLSAKETDWISVGLMETEAENYKPTSLNGHTPKNKKLLTWPYTYMLMSNNSGGAAIYKYELWNDPDDSSRCPVTIAGAISPGFSIRLMPKYYNGVEKNNEEGLNLGKFPICGWTTDVYTNWLTQNSVNIGLSLMQGAGSIAGGAVAIGTGAGAMGGAAAIGGGAYQIANTLGEVYQRSMQPPQAEGNLNSGDVTLASGNLTFTAYQMSIKKEYAQIIDEYFTMYGYKINRVKVPEKRHRGRFWYTKTINVNIDANIPQADLQKIKNCYNNGITFWSDHTYFGDYSIDNPIIV